MVQDDLADDFGDLRPEVAEALREGVPGNDPPPAGAPPRMRARRRVLLPAEPLPPWLPGVFMALLIVVGVVLGMKFAAMKHKHPAQVPVKVMETFITTVAVPNAKLRVNPGTHSAIRLILQPNQKVEVIGLLNGWAKVHVAGKEGWIYGGLLRSVGGDILGPATLIKPMVVRTYSGRVALYLGQKLLIEGHSAPGYVVAVLPDGRRVSVPSAHLLFTAGT